MNKNYIGNFQICTPLGDDLESNWKSILNGNTALSKRVYGVDNESFIGGFSDEVSFVDIVLKTFLNGVKGLNKEKLGRTQLFLSSTKGAVSNWAQYSDHRLFNIANKLNEIFPTDGNPITVSNACVSGLQAVEMANDGINNDYWDSALILAYDEVSTFVLEGFASFHALSKTICRPFDANRDGINIGSAVGFAVVSKDNIFNNEAFKIGGAFTCNDANHISGPSRTGEGLKKVIEKTIEVANIKPNFISLHGTGTPYNDAMEAIAIQRLDLNSIPIHSLKPFFGHTLGAAGLIELAICSKMLENQIAIESKGFESNGTEVSINVQTKTETLHLNSILKTASGFGGNNSALLLEKI